MGHEQYVRGGLFRCLDKIERVCVKESFRKYCTCGWGSIEASHTHTHTGSGLDSSMEEALSGDYCTRVLNISRFSPSQVAGIHSHEEVVQC